MKIALTGTQSVGKTSLVKELTKLDYFKDYFISIERSKYLKDLGIPLNNDSTLLGQFIFAAERASELLHPNLLSDRSIYDVCAFTFSSETISWEEKEKLFESSRLLVNQYDYIIYVDPEGIPIEDNGVRTIDPLFRAKIDLVIKMTLTQFPPKNLIKVKGTTEERIEKIMSYIS